MKGKIRSLGRGYLYKDVWPMERCLDFNVSVMGATEGFYEGEWQDLTSAFMRLPGCCMRRQSQE